MTAALRPEVAAHLAEEAASPEELHELQATLTLLGALPQVAPRRTFILTPDQVAATAARRAPRRFAWVWPTRWATALAAICFVATLGLGQGTTAEQAATAPSPTAVVAVTTAMATAPAFPPLTAFGTATFIEPVTVTAPVPVAPAATAADWRPARLALGALTALGALFGFVVPPFLRRRHTAVA